MPSDDVFVNLVTDTKKSVKSLTKYALAVTAAIVAVKKIGEAVGKLQDLYFKQERAEGKLQSALKATGFQLGISFREMKNFATQASTCPTRRLLHCRGGRLRLFWLLRLRLRRSLLDR